MSARPYYEALNRACDYLVRCHDCRQLVTPEMITALGSCKCGCRRVVEIRTLSEEEHTKISSGEIDFPHRAEFLKEFGGVDV